MLREMRIRNLGVIHDAEVRLSPGLNVLTGETGAGKTMVVTGLGLLLGRRADPGLIRTGAAAAIIEGIVEVGTDHPAAARAIAAGADADDVTDGLVLVRTVGADGRSRGHVAGRAAPLSVLSELGETLIAVHGQADQWRLRRPEEHRSLLDAYAGPELVGAAGAYRSCYATLADLEREHARAAAAESTRDAEVTALRAHVEEIERLKPTPGEDERLRAEEDRLGHAEALRLAAGLAHAGLAGADSRDGEPTLGALDLLAQARAALSAASEHDPTLADLHARCAELGYQVDDLAGDLAGYVTGVEADPGRLAWVQERRGQLSRLARRLGVEVADLADWSLRASERMTGLDGDGRRRSDLAAVIQRQRQELGERAAVLSRVRAEHADRMAAAIQTELTQLAMGSARIRMSVEQRDDPDGLAVPGHRTPLRYGPTGIDDVEIQLAANPGSVPRSVAKAASGGELSRVMLAVEVVLGSSDVPTFVFDEVDAGVGGRAALALGGRLAALARHSQVVVVTHLAQVAAFADQHLVIDKETDGQVTAAGIRVLDEPGRLAELSRMMAGVDGTAALDHARDLLQHARATIRKGPGPTRPGRPGAIRPVRPAAGAGCGAVGA
ncbi:MAG TPA: DNA repair protein RecN [Dermatophilaceae bacterium]|nr:DNA repair protein RecN [Dermatophilaceae bacterium]